VYRNVIVGYDDSEQAGDALAFARMLAGTVGADLTLVEVMPYVPLLSEVAVGPPTTLGIEREAMRERLTETARSLDVSAEAVESSSPARGLHETAERLEADLVVVGSSHRGPVGRVLAGSVGRSLLNGAPCPVAVAPLGYRHGGDHALRCIGVGFDGSPEASEALHAGAELGRRGGATLRVVRAVPPIDYGYRGAWLPAEPDLLRSLHEQSQRQLDDALEALAAELRAEGRVIDGDPVTVLLEEAGEGIDLLMVGSRGYGRLRGVLLGSVSAELIRSAPCPVMAVPRSILNPGPSATAKPTDAA
jgi:nucleotide-binding universal stress UspA family protein